MDCAAAQPLRAFLRTLKRPFGAFDEPPGLRLFMISVVVATLDCERALLSSLAALVPAAMDAVVSEVIVADGGSRDGTAAIADAAGCRLVRVEGTLGRRLKTAAGTARARALLFLQPGTVLEPHWADEARRFLERTPGQMAATFARAANTNAPLREALLLLAVALGAAHSRRGLLLARRFYDALGGHSAAAAAPEAELMARIGRRRLFTLSAKAFDAERAA